MKESRFTGELLLSSEDVSVWAASDNLNVRGLVAARDVRGGVYAVDEGCEGEFGSGACAGAEEKLTGLAGAGYTVDEAGALCVCSISGP